MRRLHAILVGSEHRLNGDIHEHEDLQMQRKKCWLNHIVSGYNSESGFRVHPTQARKKHVINNRWDVIRCPGPRKSTRKQWSKPNCKPTLKGPKGLAHCEVYHTARKKGIFFLDLVMESCCNLQKASWEQNMATTLRTCYCKHVPAINMDKASLFMNTLRLSYNYLLVN